MLNFALGIVNRIKTDYDKTMALTDIALAMTHLGNYDGAKKHISDASTEVRKITNAFNRFEALRTVAEAMAEMGAFTHRPDLIEIAVNLSKKIGGGFHRALTFSRLAECYAQVDESEHAKECIKTASDNIKNITDGYQVVFVLSKIALAMDNINRYMTNLPGTSSSNELLAQADALLEDINDHYFKAKALIEISETMLALDMVDQSQEMVNKAVISAYKVTDKYNKAMVFSEIAVPLARYGEYLQAKRGIEKSIELAKQLGDEYYKALALKGTAEILPELIPVPEFVPIFVERAKGLVLAEKYKGADLLNAAIKVENAEELIKLNKFEEAVDQAVVALEITENVTGVHSKLEVQLPEKLKKKLRVKKAGGPG